MDQLPIETKEKKKKREDNFFAECVAEFSLMLVLEILLSFIWRFVLFIPRALIRAWSNIS